MRRLLGLAAALGMVGCRHPSFDDHLHAADRCQCRVCDDEVAHWLPGTWEIVEAKTGVSTRYEFMTEILKTTTTTLTSTTTDGKYERINWTAKISNQSVDLHYTNPKGVAFYWWFLFDDPTHAHGELTVKPPGASAPEERVRKAILKLSSCR